MSLHPTNVTILVKSLGLGGAERLIVDALPYLDRERFSYHFAYVTPWKDALAPAIAEQGFEITCLGQRYSASRRRSHVPQAADYTPARSLSALAFLPPALMRLQQMMKHSECDVVHADLPVAGILARIAGRRLGVPVIYTEHNLQERYHPVTRWANRATYGWNEVVFAVSEEVAASIRRNGLVERKLRSESVHPDVRTLPNGVPVEAIRQEARDLDDLRRELDLPEGSLVVGAVAVFRRQKRLLDWLAVAERVASMHENVLFLLAGEGPELPSVRTRIRELGLEQRVRLPGFRADGRRLMGLVDVYLMTSAYEGLPLAMLEAMALAKPVVSTRVGGVPEVVVPGKHGFLAPVGDIDLLAAQVNAILRNSAAAREMGQNGALEVEKRFHTRERVRIIQSTYCELVDTRQIAGEDGGSGP